MLVGWGVAGCDADEVCDPYEACDADAVDVCDAAGVPDAGAEAWAEVLAVAVDVPLDPAEALLEAPWPVGDGVRVPA
ncbi:hypothetical protein EAS64_18650 [Trebonia kvetii]|uniref:Uncharacterized protein n=1 Tax=Trebonia kvetii TaxID=2480626 RepID=A0A6P2BZL1_9ACTN|nr:hypothetical protein [Trebonia kvetii]TVZ04388.1 hypothetical protein EAS64_18650 [Trebonia kvetii]